MKGPRAGATSCEAPKRASFPGCLRLPRRWEYLQLIVLACLGVLGTHFSLPLFFGVDFLFGSIATLIAIRLFGTLSGLLCAAPAAAYTYLLWEHGYAIPIFMAEALVVGFVVCRAKTENFILVDAGFWALLGMPMAWLFYTNALHMDATAVQLVMLKQGINGVANAVAASLILNVLAAKHWFGFSIGYGKQSLRQTLINLLSAVALAPALLMAVIANRDEIHETRREIAEDLSARSSHLAKELDNWNAHYGLMTRATVGRYLWSHSEHRGTTGEQFNELVYDLPHVAGIRLIDSNGQIMQSTWDYYPSSIKKIDPHFESYRAARETGEALMVRSQDGHDPDWHLELVVYLSAIDRGGAYAVLDLSADYLRNALPIESENEVAWIAVDANKRILAIGDPGASLPTGLPEFLDQARPIGHGVFEFLPVDATGPAMTRWRQAVVFTKIEIGHEFPWSLIVTLPMRDRIIRLQEYMANKFILPIIALGVMLLLVPMLSRIVTAPLTRLASITRRVSMAEGDYSQFDWPSSSVGEISSLSDSFRKMVERLSRETAETRRVADDLSRLIDTANAPIFGVDANGRVNEWNQTTRRITGYDKEQAMGRDLVAEFITDDYKASVKAVLDKALRGEETANYEFPLYTKTGQRVDILLNATARRDSSGNIVGVVGVGQDITEWKKAEVQLIQSSKLATLGEMATGVAHELNQPLNVIRMAADNAAARIGDGELDADYLRAKLERIGAQTERAAAIIDHMRMFGRKSMDNMTPFDPRETVDGAINMVGQQLRLSDIEVVLDLPETCRRVNGHAVQMEQVLLNLLANARDAIAANGGTERKITVAIDDGAADSVVVSVQDTGGGIARDALDRVFEPFYTTKEVGKGTGLGLSVSYGIIRDMGGVIEAVNVDGGARFTITLPVAARNARDQNLVA